MRQDSCKVYTRTFGCQMNVRDSEYVIGLLVEAGYAIANSVEEADVVIFNSCSVRKHAEDRLFSNIADLKTLKKRKPDLIVGLMGCTAQGYRENALRKAPILDFVCGPGNEGDIPAIVGDLVRNRCPVVAVSKVDTGMKRRSPDYREKSFRAYVSIGEGCDNYCSYCIVPYVRGRERSRPMVEVVREVESLAARGYKEITLLGQNVNSYGKRVTGHRSQVTGFVKLLERLNGVKGIERIRFMTSHPKDASVPLFRAMRDLDKVCEHLHLPLQSGSDRILKLMRRGYTAGKYLALVSAYRKHVPDGAITTDIIVGFPTESDDDFGDTMRIVREVGFDSAFAFKYSPRPPAASARMEDDVPREAKDRRLQTVLNEQCEISRKRNLPYRGTIVEVLVEGMTEDGAGMTGKTRTGKTVIFPAGAVSAGETVRVLVEEARPHTLIGKVV